MMTPEQLTGQQQTHLIDSQGMLIHRDTAQAYGQLQAAAKQAGFCLTTVSSFRSFEQQRQIWNGKFTGQRPILDRNSQPMESAILTDEERVFAILRWSMLPGASRHHWGCDIDVCDKHALPQGYRLKLIPQEYDQGGYLAEFSAWLDENLSLFNFFRPYARDLNGVAREPWHISYRPVAQQAQDQLSQGLIADMIAASDIQGKAAILANLEQIYQQYITNISA